MPKKNSRLARLSGLALAGAGLSHFTSPGLWEPITNPIFPHRTRQHIYTNGGVETLLGLGFSVRQTRSVAIVGLIGYGAYLVGNIIRGFQTE